MSEAITRLKNQILGQGTTGQWSGQGFGSAEANAEDMAKILSGVGITDIRQFGKVDKLEPVQQTGFTLNGQFVQNPRPGMFYVEDRVEGNDESYMIRRDLSPEQIKQIQPVYGVYLGDDPEGGGPQYRRVDSSTVTTKDGQTFAVTGQTFGNKLTGQAVPTTYASDSTAWGGTYAGKGNTGYRVQFAPDGTPYFYTTGASSKDKFLTTIAPIIAMALPFAAPALAGGIGAALAGGASAATQAAIGNAIIQGVMSEATGGDFLKGAALSGVGSLASGLQPGLSEALGGGATGNIASNALIGGVMSELSGGDFVKGALTSGIGSGINQAKLAAADEYLNSLPGGQGVYTDDLPDMSDFDVSPVQPVMPPAVIDTSFTPDYSLSTGAPVVPGMGAQGIQVPTINEIIDVVNQPVDYALPIPDSGLGLQMPNLDAMGGGQGITVPVDGGTLTEAGVIPDVFVPDLGDPNSFINQPAPDVSVSIPELPEQKPVDIDTELALLDVANALTPAVVGSLLADKVINQPDDQPTGFAIVPIPGDWRSPEYSMAFTPSQAIDFGNAGMLAGTQFARKPQAATPSFYNLSDVINTLNYQSVPFVQQQYQMPEQSFSVPDILQQFQTNPNVGMNETIGNLDGSPATLNSIIAGIQSQYG
jgi:hypothetical protein